MGNLLSNVGSVIGTNSNNGLNWQAGSASIHNPVTDNDVIDANDKVGTTLGEQHAFAQAVAQNGGLANQSNMFGQQQNLNTGLAGMNGVGNESAAMNAISGTQNAMQGQNAIGNQSANLGQMQGLSSALAGNHGVQNQNSVFNQQQGLANQLQGVANGTGPNPAQNLLNQQTGNNIQQQAALMASQRGAGANAGLMARQAAMQGAGIQQNAVGQAATMQANQQLGAMGQLGAQQAQMAGLANSQIGQQQGQQQAIQNATAQQIAAMQGQQAMQGNLAAQQIGQQQAGINAGTAAANTQVGQAMNALQGASNSAQGRQANLLQGMGNQNNANVSNNANMNNANAGIQGIAAQQQAKGISGALSSAGAGMSQMGGGMMNNIAGSGLASEGMAHGGMVPRNYADGGMTQSTIQTPAPAAAPTYMGDSSGPQSNVGQHLSAGVASPEIGSPAAMPPPPSDGGGSGGGGGGSSMMSMLPMLAMLAANQGGQVDARPGKVPAMVSPGEVYIPPGGVKEVAEGKKDPIEAGKKIPGKAKVKGDSLKNDTVSTTLEEGGIVLPKSVMESKHPHWAAHAFVSALLAKKGLR